MTWKVPFVILLAGAGTEAVASDKGIKAELVEASVTLFCSTSFADDLRPIVEGQHKLDIAKMSQESLRRKTDALDRLWVEVSTKHRAALEALGLSARLKSVESAYLEVAAKEAWGTIQAKCPSRIKSADGPELVVEFLQRRIADLK